MFGVTTQCVRQVSARLEDRYDCLVFHATGTGGRSMEKLLDSGHLAGVLDVTTTEVCDLMMGGVFPATEDRFGAAIRTRVPYVGSCGALDMVNFGPYDTVPERYRDRNLYKHNPQVTLMRTTAVENDRIGRWIGERLNRMDGPVRFLLPKAVYRSSTLREWRFTIRLRIRRCSGRSRKRCARPVPASSCGCRTTSTIRCSATHSSRHSRRWQVFGHLASAPVDPYEMLDESVARAAPPLCISLESDGRPSGPTHPRRPTCIELRENDSGRAG